ncbi:MAG: flavin reductase family protein [Tissierellia bacterium]|nr:flavin reductase family protein [Tissierellia bacterium]
MEYKDFLELDKFYEQLPKGAFLTVSDGENVNTMTIGWALNGIIWRKPVIAIAVRKSRYTYELIEKAEDFTISCPLNKDLSKALMICGTKSGREIDKFKEANIGIADAKSNLSPIIGECELHYECKIIYSQFMDEDSLFDEAKDLFYKEPDFHKFYFGELVNSYIR